MRRFALLGTLLAIVGCDGGKPENTGVAPQRVVDKDGQAPQGMGPPVGPPPGATPGGPPPIPVRKH